ncbi:terpene synthase [Dentipellis sp. KUC8613]|nr:terpene synthase [Dentipellis sp. KUC8613]
MSSLNRDTTTLTLPDLLSRCPFPLNTNVHGAEVASDSESWLLEHAELSPERRAAFCALQSGALSALCYPTTPPSRLRVIADYMNYLFKLDDWSDELNLDQVDVLRGRVMGVLYDPSPSVNKTGGDPVAFLTASFFSRLASSAGPRCVARFVSTMEDFFAAVTQQAHDRICDSAPNLQTYIALRRDTSGCRPCFALIEYAAGIDLPHSVAKHPCVCTMEDAANDVVSWSNDIYSFNVEQARGDTHNAVVIVMREQGLGIQDALDHVGDLCTAAIETFERARAQLPSTGTQVDTSLDAYVAGLQNWMVGSLHWSFITERYFGERGSEVKKALKVKLLPQKAEI